MSKRPSVRRLIAHLRERLSGPPPRVGERFLPEHLALVEDFREITDQAMKLLGAGVVQSWEGALAELARALELALGPDDAAALAELWSDALVGAEQPVGMLTRFAARDVDKGLAAAEASGQLSALLRPLEARLSALPDKVAQGWSGTTEHLRPLFEALGDPSLAGRFAAGGPEIADSLGRAAAEFQRSAAELPDAPELSKALFELLDTYQSAALSCFELNIDARYRLVADTIKRMESTL